MAGADVDMVSMSQPSSAAWRILLPATGVIFLHWHTLRFLVSRWYSFPDDSYGFFVPLVALYLVWLKRKELARIQTRPSRVGFPILALALLLQLAGVIVNIGHVQAVSLVVLILGVVLLLGGKELLAALSFQILYLLIMIPMPGVVYGWFAFPLQLLASGASATILELLRIPVDQQGNVFHLSGITLQVAEACSGIRSLVGLLGMGILLGYLTTPRLWERVTLALSAILIAVAANIIRVAGTGIIYQYAGEKWGQGFYHGFSAWLVFVFAMVVLLAESVSISALFPLKSKAVKTPGKEAAQ